MPFDRIEGTMHDIPAQHLTAPGRRSLGNAEGVLINLRHYSADEAFDELVAVSNSRRVPLFTLASAVVELAAGGQVAHEGALLAAQAEWPALRGLELRS
jgi:hypothetical protein